MSPHPTPRQEPQTTPAGGEIGETQELTLPPRYPLHWRTSAISSATYPRTVCIHRRCVFSTMARRDLVRPVRKSQSLKRVNQHLFKRSKSASAQSGRQSQTLPRDPAAVNQYLRIKQYTVSLPALAGEGGCARPQASADGWGDSAIRTSPHHTVAAAVIQQNIRTGESPLPSAVA